MVDSLLFAIKQHDTKPRLRTRCLDDTTAVDLTLATTVRVLVKNLITGALLLNGTMTKEDQTQAATKGYVYRDWVTGDTSTSGSFSLEVQVEWADGGIQTFPANGYGTLDVVADLGP